MTLRDPRPTGHAIRAAERCAARQHQPPTPGQGTQPTNTPSPTATSSHKIEKDLELRRDGPEDDLDL
jgi:hypothetical protein